MYSVGPWQGHRRRGGDWLESDVTSLPTANVHAIMRSAACLLEAIRRRHVRWLDLPGEAANGQELRVLGILEPSLQPALSSRPPEC